MSSKSEALEALHSILKPGDTVYTVIRSVSRSGMSRCMDVYAIGEDRRPRYLTGYCVALGIGSQSRAMWRRRAGMRVNGCGMDMGFHVVYSLGRMLFPNGYTPSEAGKGGRNGADPAAVDQDGGYALRHEWI